MKRRIFVYEIKCNENSVDFYLLDGVTTFAFTNFSCSVDSPRSSVLICAVDDTIVISKFNFSGNVQMYINNKQLHYPKSLRNFNLAKIFEKNRFCYLA